MRGFDNHALNAQLLYAASLDEIAVGAGVHTYGKDKPHHTTLLHGGSWNNLASGLPIIDLSPNPDWLDCPAVDTADLDFTSGDFSGVMWVNLDGIAGDNMLFCRGLVPSDGWLFYVAVGGVLTFDTAQAATWQLTTGGELAAGTWTMVGFSRSGASVRVFQNGLDATDTPEAHIDPVTANRELHIGVYDDEVMSPIDGKIAGGPCCPRLWGRYVQPWEHRQMFHMERHWTGV